MTDAKIGKAKIKGISSDLSLKDCSVDEIESKTISKDINYKLLSFNKIYVDSTSGDISIVCPKTKINCQFNTMSKDISIDGIEIDKTANLPIMILKTISGDISVKGEYEKIEKSFISEIKEPIVSTFEESYKKDEKEKIIQIMLDGKISEKESIELLKGFGFTDLEIDTIFEEYLFRKANMNEK